MNQVTDVQIKRIMDDIELAEYTLKRPETRKQTKVIVAAALDAKVKTLKVLGIITKDKFEEAYNIITEHVLKEYKDEEHH